MAGLTYLQTLMVWLDRLVERIPDPDNVGTGSPVSVDPVFIPLLGFIYDFNELPGAGLGSGSGPLTEEWAILVPGEAGVTKTVKGLFLTMALEGSEDLMVDVTLRETTTEIELAAATGLTTGDNSYYDLIDAALTVGEGVEAKYTISAGTATSVVVNAECRGSAAP